MIIFCIWGLDPPTGAAATAAVFIHESIVVIIPAKDGFKFIAYPIFYFYMLLHL